MVEQFGLAMIPRCLRMSWGFTSGTTRGTSGSIRKALELSTTTAPAAAAIGLQWREMLAGVLERTISIPENASGGKGLDRMVLTPELHGFARTPLGGEELDRGDRKIALLQQADHPLTHRTTGPNNGDVLHDRAPVSRQDWFSNGKVPVGNGRQGQRMDSRSIVGWKSEPGPAPGVRSRRIAVGAPGLEFRSS